MKFFQQDLLANEKLIIPYGMNIDVLDMIGSTNQLANGKEHTGSLLITISNETQDMDSLPTTI